MKKLIVLSLISLSWKLSAQVVITQSNFPTAGTTVSRNLDTLKVEFDPGTPGPGNTWNYGGLNSDTILTYNFLDASATPYVADYPGSTLALEMATDLYAYFSVTNTAAEELGFGGDAGAFGFSGTTIKFKYNQPLTFMPFPAQLGTSFVDSASGEVRLPGSAIGLPSIDSVALKRYIKRTGNFDASGSLTVNTENWQNALRYKRLDESKDTVFLKIFGTWTEGSAFVPPTTNTDLTYEWYVNGHSFPVLIATMNAIGDSALSREFYKPGTAKSKSSNLVFSVYPNPASNVIYFNGNTTNVQSVVIYNMIGQKQEVQAIVKNNQVEISLNGLSNGIYSYQIVGKDSKVISTGKFVIQK